MRALTFNLAWRARPRLAHLQLTSALRPLVVASPARLAMPTGMHSAGLPRSPGLCARPASALSCSARSRLCARPASALAQPPRSPADCSRIIIPPRSIARRFPSNLRHHARVIQGGALSRGDARYRVQLHRPRKHRLLQRSSLPQGDQGLHAPVWLPERQGPQKSRLRHRRPGWRLGLQEHQDRRNDQAQQGWQHRRRARAQGLQRAGHPLHGQHGR
mmetsp:Transcript_22199/g.55345  ORF Transcript_22199/g.55345 Transcript_22199/m.55345 type:complete len:217 (+) Transcript_22199:79-729(+)